MEQWNSQSEQFIEVEKRQETVRKLNTVESGNSKLGFVTNFFY